MNIPHLIFSILTLGTLAVFFMSISDFSERPGATYILPPKIVKTIPIFYGIPTLLLVWAVIVLPEVGLIALCVLALQMSSTWLYRSAKAELGEFYTKAGMVQPRLNRPVRTGPYRLIGHPIYISIFIYVGAACLLVFAYNPWPPSWSTALAPVIPLLMLGTSAHILLILAAAAVKENTWLRTLQGDTASPEFADNAVAD